MTIKSFNKDFLIKKKNPWNKSKYLWNLYKKAETSEKLTRKAFEYAKKIGIEIFSSPFDIGSVDFLEKLGCPAYKIASPEINHIPLIEKVAKTNKPIILSLGLANLQDIEIALKTIKKNGNNKVILLQCVSSYPARIEEQNINSLKNINKKFKTIVGLSDHTKGYIAPLTAVAIGAKAIEKHFNLSNNKSVDSFFSTSEKEFKNMVNVSYSKNITSAIKDSDLIIVHTEWNDFKSINFNKTVKNRKFKIFDMRNIYSSTKMSEQKIKYFAIGC